MPLSSHGGSGWSLIERVMVLGVCCFWGGLRRFVHIEIGPAIRTFFSSPVYQDPVVLLCVFEWIRYLVGDWLDIFPNV